MNQIFILAKDRGSGIKYYFNLIIGRQITTVWWDQVTVSLRDVVALPPEFQASTQQAKSHSKARLLNSPTQGLASKALIPISRCSQSFKEIFQVMLKLRTEGKKEVNE